MRHSRFAAWLDFECRITITAPYYKRCIRNILINVYASFPYF